MAHIGGGLSPVVDRDRLTVMLTKCKLFIKHLSFEMLCSCNIMWLFGKSVKEVNFITTLVQRFKCSRMSEIASVLLHS